MASSKMVVKRSDTTVLTPRAKDKFASVGTPGRVINVDAVMDGGGTAILTLTHPDGTVDVLASLTSPVLAKNEVCGLSIRASAVIRTGQEEE